MATIHTQCINSSQKSHKRVKKKKNTNADTNVVLKRNLHVIFVQWLWFGKVLNGSYFQDMIIF